MSWKKNIFVKILQGFNKEALLRTEYAPSPLSNSDHPKSSNLILCLKLKAGLIAIYPEKRGRLLRVERYSRECESKGSLKFLIKIPKVKPNKTQDNANIFKIGGKILISGEGKINQERPAPEMAARVPRHIKANKMNLSSSCRDFKGLEGGIKELQMKRRLE